VKGCFQRFSQTGNISFATVEQQQQSLEHTNAHVDGINCKVMENSKRVPELQRALDTADAGIRELQEGMRKHMEEGVGALRRALEQLGLDTRDLQDGQSRSGAELQNLRSDFEKYSLLLQDARKVLDKTCSTTANLQKGLEAMTSREAQLGARLEGWKQQWSKLHPAMEELKKDGAFLKQRNEHHDAVLFSLQQGYATCFSSVEGLQSSHNKMGNDMQELSQSLQDTRQCLGDARDDLTRATSFSNNLHTALQKTDGDLHKVSTRASTLEQQHCALSEGLEKTNTNLSDLASEHRKSVSGLQLMRHDLDQTNEALGNTRNQLESAENNLQGVKNDLGRTNDTVQRIGHGVELCQAGFSGLQKGFVETGTHISSRPFALPKLGLRDEKLVPKDDVRPPDETRRRPGKDIPPPSPRGWDPRAVPRSPSRHDDSTCASVLSSRRTSATQSPRSIR